MLNSSVVWEICTICS